MKKKINSQYFLLTTIAIRKFQVNKKSGHQSYFLKKVISLGSLILLIAISSFANPGTHKLTTNKKNVEKRMIKTEVNISPLTMDQFEIN